MNDLPFEHGSSGDRGSTLGDRMSLDVFAVVGRKAIRGDILEKRSLWTSDGSHIRLAQLRCRLDQRVEHHLQVEGGATYDLEHICRRGLLLQRLAQLVEQPSVLDGDYGLRRKIGDQLDLLFGERL